MKWFSRAPKSAPACQVLMVCMGNICRSPTAEGVLRHKLERAGLAEVVLVDSAGTYGGHVGDPPDPRAQRHAKARGVDLSKLRARRVTEADFHRFDLIVAMDEDNLAALQQLRPVDTPEPVLLTGFVRRPDAPREVPDPYYGGPEGFGVVLDLVDEACEGLLAHLQARLENRDDRPLPGNFPGRT
jgi:protein-tyrosine phosphatase